MERSDRTGLAWIALIIAADQLTKYLVRAHFSLGESVQLAPFFSITHLANTGIAFSMFQGANTVFMVLSAVVIVALGFWYVRNRTQVRGIFRIALLLIAAGALGNFIDRALFGQVTDFLDVNFGSYHWPAFNVADSCISVGGVILFFSLLLVPEKTPRTGGSRAGS